MMRLAGRLGLQLWIVGFIIFFGAEIVHLEPGLRILTQLLYGVPLAILVLMRLRGPWDRLDAAVLIAIGLYLVVALAARDRTQALNTVALVAAFGALFMTARREATGELRGSLVSGIVVGLALTLAFNGWLLVEEKLRWMSAVGSAPLEGLTVFPWQTVNAMPVLVLLAIPFIAWLPGRSSRWIFAGAVVIAGAVVVPISLGRAGWLGLGVAAIVGVVLHPRARAALGSSRRRFAAVAGAGVVAIGGAVLVLPSFVEALQSSGRAALWSQAAEMIGARPLLGHGPGAYSWARLEFGPDSARWLAVILTHNVPLQTLIDGGVILFASLAVPLGTWAARVIRTFAALTTADRIALAALAGFAVSTLLDDFSFNPSVTAIVIVTAAFLVPVVPSPRIGRPLDGVPLGALALVLAISLPQVWAVDEARAAAQVGRTAATEGRWDDAFDAFNRATERHPENAGYWLGLGLARSHLGAVEAARGAYEEAARLSPGDARAHGALAALQSGAEADASLARAAELSFDDAQYAIRLAEALNGDPQSAVTAYGRAAAISPSAVATAWDAVDDDSIVASEIAGAARDFLERAPRPGIDADRAVQWDLALLQGDLPDDAPSAWKAVDAARNGEERDAAEFADQAIAASPHDRRSWQALAMTAAYRCDSVRLEEAVNALEAIGGTWGGGTWGGAADETGAVRPRREFIYREPGLGSTQPAGVAAGTPPPWPWNLVPDPEPCP